MRSIPHLICASCLIALTALADSRVTVTVGTREPGYAVPPDFAGVSIFTGTEVADHRGVSGNLFSGTNTQLIALFRNSGIHHLRLGATGSPTSQTKNLEPADIDSLFAFAKATGIKVIYSLHALNAVGTAKYVWANYRPYVDYFAFDNEPDNRALGGSGAAVDSYANFLDGWNNVAKSVIAAAPGAKFAGPDASGRVLSRLFVRDEKESGLLSLITQHIYVGGNPIKHGVDAAQAVDNMLSFEWVTNRYPGLYRDALHSVVTNGFPFRLTESDDYTHGVTNASDTFAAALWALDYLHWWAAHGAAGVNFQNTEWLRTDTFYLDSSGNYQVHPKACAIKAFDLGSHGREEEVGIENVDGLNLTAYAIGDKNEVVVTIINKEHGTNGRAANITIKAQGSTFSASAVMLLTASSGDVRATNNVTLGGATIANNALWHGEWTPLAPGGPGDCWLKVPAASAALVKLTIR